MARAKRVLSFVSQWSHSFNNNSPSAPPSPSPPSPKQSAVTVAQRTPSDEKLPILDTKAVSATASVPASPSSSTPHRREPSGSGAGSRSASRAGSRRNSLALGYQAPMMEISQDTLPELAPIFTYLNSHANKLYQEGYFLKLHDLDARGRPSPDRVWNECFAQLVGTVLSLWDAAQLDAAGEDGEVVPTFINLTDASIKMIESLPMNGADTQSLQNVLSISTAANNRYLLHFNSLHSLTQWTAGIRLAMYEHATLQEAYTGSILAGKGKTLNNIKSIMDRSRFPSEDWARVRFGAGTPWRRCWCVITPPDEKAFAKAQKDAKKRSAYERAPVIKGDVKFYDTRKVTKKTKPIATITDAFAAYAIYPQSQALIEQSTLIKVEGNITIHGSQTTTTEGFIFVMPETHPAISGFEMMLRWLLPCYDTFALYGRPNKLIADVLDTRSLMFAMPSSRRYGYLELIDVAGLIHTDGSQAWSEREWRKQMKVLTSKRITSGPTEAGTHRRGNSRTSLNLPSSASKSSLNLPSRSAGVAFDDRNTRSTPGSRHGSPALNGAFSPPAHTESAPAGASSLPSPHKRSASDRFPRRTTDHGRPSYDDERPPMPPPHRGQGSSQDYKQTQEPTTSERYSSDTNDVEYHGHHNGYYDPSPIEGFHADSSRPLQPVQAPPRMAHAGGQRPPVKPNQMPDLRMANAGIDQATLHQLNEANGGARGGNQFGGYAVGPPGGANALPSSLQPGGPGNATYNTPAGRGQGSVAQGGSRLPTIPGTPAFEQGNQFDAQAQAYNDGSAGRPSMHRASSSIGSTKRKPLPSRGPNPNADYQRQYY